MAEKKVRTRKTTKRTAKPPFKSFQRPPPLIPILLLVVGAMLLSVSVALPWGTMDVDTKLGIIPVSLEAQVYEYGVSYKADLSGTGGLIQGSGNVSKELSETRVFVTGLGAFQETIGFIKGSSKYRNHTIEMYTVPENNRAKVVVETYSSTIPWWPAGIAQECRITIRIIEQPVNVSYVEVQKVWFELHQTVEGNDRYKVIWESQPKDRLKVLNDEQVYTTKLTVDPDLGAFSIVGRAQLELIDKNGKSNCNPAPCHEMRSFSGNPKMIDLWTMDQGQTLRIGLLLSAFPITTISIVLMFATIALAYRRTPLAWKFAAVAAVLAMLAIAFYATGVMALIELTGYGDWFTWSPAGLGLAVSGAALGIVATVLLFLELKKGSEPLPAKALKDKVDDHEGIAVKGAPPSEGVRKKRPRRVPVPSSKAPTE